MRPALTANVFSVLNKYAKWAGKGWPVRVQEQHHKTYTSCGIASHFNARLLNLMSGASHCSQCNKLEQGICYFLECQFLWFSEDARFSRLLIPNVERCVPRRNI